MSDKPRNPFDLRFGDPRLDELWERLPELEAPRLEPPPWLDDKLRQAASGRIAARKRAIPFAKAFAAAAAVALTAGLLWFALLPGATAPRRAVAAVPIAAMPALPAATTAGWEAKSFDKEAVELGVELDLSFAALSSASADNGSDEGSDEFSVEIPALLTDNANLWEGT
jgi:hypothetical protein